ncbi:hypothetical protein DESC_580021 [Desulfosarcina cetonica]|nr:hypothetical protein DESC_580021 [Desulfosarcina cetonica]
MEWGPRRLRSSGCRRAYSERAPHFKRIADKGGTVSKELTRHGQISILVFENTASNPGAGLLE